MMILSRFIAANANRKILVFIDLSIITKAIAYKMYNTLSNSKGQDTSILYGSLRKFLSICRTLKTVSVQQIIGVHDQSGSIIHKNLYKNYKSTRNTKFKRSRFDHGAEFESDFNRERDVLLNVLRKLGYYALMFDRTEGDAVIAYLIKRLFEDYPDQFAFLVITSDHDFAQLLAFSPRIILMDPLKYEFYDDSNYKTFIKLNIPLTYITIARALIGDKSDNIKGVKGFGPKYTEKLINEVYQKEGHAKAVNIQEFIQYVETADLDALTDNKRLKLISQRKDAELFYKMTDLTNPENVLLPEVVSALNDIAREISVATLSNRNIRIKQALQVLLNENINLTTDLYHAVI